MQAPPLDTTAIARVRSRLDRAGYTPEAIAGLLRTDELMGTERAKLGIYLQRTSGGSPLETLLRLFVLGIPEPVERIEGLEDAVLAGLLRVEGGAASATVQLRAYDDLIVAYDFVRRGEAGLPPDWVMGISTSTLELAGLTIRSAGERVLDLGTGSGFQALLAAGHAAEVTATDVNPRAVAMARLNAALNGLAIETIEGSFFEPVGARDFDLVVSNPPFIIAPESTHTFMHGGHGASARIAREAPAHLAEGGICQFLTDWAIGDEGDGSLAGWFEGSGCEVWVLRQEVYDPEEYASLWIETGDDHESQARHLERYLAWFEREGVRAIGHGLVTMRRRGPGWLVVDDGPARVDLPCGDDVLRGLEARSLLRERGDAGLLARRLRASPQVLLSRDTRPSADGWEQAGIRARRVTGLRYERDLEEEGAALLARCDGTRPLGDVLGGEGLLPLARELFLDGFLELAS